MERIAYNPPPGTPPLEYVYGGNGHVIQPPDAWWKRETETYVYDTIHHPATGNKLRDILKERTIWVVDEERTSRGDRPDNTAWLEIDELSYLLSERWAPLNRFIQRISEMDAKDAADLSAREDRHRKAIEKQQAAHEREKKLYSSKLDKNLSETKAVLQQKIAQQADDLGLSIGALEELINERKSKTTVRKRGK